MTKTGWRVPLAVLVVAGLTAVLAVLLIHVSPVGAQAVCSGTQVNPGDDLDAIVNSDSRYTATTFCLNPNPDGSVATYNISATLLLKDGDRIVGQEGATETRGPATYGHPVVAIRPSVALDKLVSAMGKGNEIKWVDLAGATGRVVNGNPQTGTGVAITAGSADSNFLVQYVVVHGNDAAGILSARGRVLNSEFYDNTNNAAFLGFNGSAMKNITEYEAAYNYVHNEQGTGIWCDVGCTDDPARQNGYWVHDNLVVDNGRSGIRYESSPTDLAPGVHQSQSTALIEDNEVHGNSYNEDKGGISARDTQNALIRNNVFGAKTIAGVYYRANAGKPGAVRASDSGRTSRTDLWNIDIVNNDLNGEGLNGCELSDKVVYCANNNYR